MKLLKNSERNISASSFKKSFKECGFTQKILGTWCKWIEVYRGQMQASLTVYEMENKEEGIKGYLVEDSLGRIACEMIPTKKEVLDYFKEHDWLPEKQWHIEEGGMTEELWNIWNGKEEEEE